MISQTRYLVRRRLSAQSHDDSIGLNATTFPLITCLTAHRSSAILWIEGGDHALHYLDTLLVEIGQGTLECRCGQRTHPSGKFDYIFVTGNDFDVVDESVVAARFSDHEALFGRVVERNP